MTVNFNYRAIPNLTRDLNGGHFSKWPAEHTCINMSVFKSLGKMILVSKYLFSGPSITKKTITNTQILPLTLMVAIFKNILKGVLLQHVKLHVFIVINSFIYEGFYNFKPQHCPHLVIFIIEYFDLI